jgi:hypothetical protein
MFLTNNTNEKIFKKNNLDQMRQQIFFWVAAIFVGRSERGNKQNFIILGLVYVFWFSLSPIKTDPHHITENLWNMAKMTKQKISLLKDCSV